MTGPLTDEERYRLDLQGFLVRRNVLGRRQLSAIHDQIDGLGLANPGSTIQSQRFTGLLEAGGWLRDLMDHEAVLDVVRELCGAQVRLDHAYGILMAPGTSGLGLHGGGTPFDPAQYYEVKGGRIHTGLVAVQWALVDHRVGEGGLAVVPGSHKANFWAPGSLSLDSDLVHEVPMAAGDVVFFTESLTHGTLPWRARRTRRTLLYKYSPGNSSWDNRPPVRAEAVAGLSERQQRLVQPPSVAYHQAP
jgi:hypothetical protein